MLSRYVSPVFTAFFRQMRHHRLYTAINIAGLALGLATCLTFGLIVRYEFTFDRWLTSAGDIYRLDAVNASGGKPAEVADAPFRVYDALRTAFPEITHATRIRPDGISIITPDDIHASNALYVDHDFFATLPYPLIRGNAASALLAPNSIVLSQERALAYFHTIDVIGRRLTVDHDGRKADLTVTGVLGPVPGNTTLRPDMLIPIDSAMLASPAFRQWGIEGGYLFFRLRSPSDARHMQNAMAQFSTDHVPTQVRQNGELRDWRVRELPSLHFLDGTLGASDASRTGVIMLGLIGVLAILSALINTINLSTARGLLRAREVAMRKTLGATRRDLIVQFMGEAMLLVLCAAIPALALIEIAIPTVNALGGWDIVIPYGLVLPALLALTVVVGLLAGAYPALWLSSYQPARVLAASRMATMGRLGAIVRLGLVVVQFGFAIGLSASSVVILRQSVFVRDMNRGFESSGLAFIPFIDNVGPSATQLSLMDAFRSIPGVTTVSYFYTMPGNYGFFAGDYFSPATMPDHRPRLEWQDIGRDYFQLFGMHLIAGRLFDDAHGEDDQQKGSGIHSAIIDVSSARALGYTTPEAALGQTIRKNTDRASWRIIGVVNDIRLKSAREQSVPHVYFYTSSPYRFTSAGIRFENRSKQDVKTALQAIWRQRAPSLAFNAVLATDLLSGDYRDDERRGELLAIGAGIAIFIAVMGMYALASFTVARRMLEVGIRKTLGATTGRVLGLLMGQFLKPVVGAGLIGCALAWMMMRNWLSGFDARIALSPIYFASVFVAALFVAALTVLFQTLRVARAEPARALRAE
ncbi:MULTISPECIES: ABC transporter permease [Gluconobacter]|uniref:FtsX-like permease family protein n=1 Tax=Gluconobacter cadivus TaxID=2728101 RepID=A0ABR9YVV7_9PROT|nr:MULTISPECIES: ABC transporter permease [Gluconobacter]MBF0888653.1 FtsX-like permease family protein [Gluconobacter cadivus]MBS1060008.1 ABC transporter permease [Gluconobacter sp. Dm-44]